MWKHFLPLLGAALLAACASASVGTRSAPPEAAAPEAVVITGEGFDVGHWWLQPVVERLRDAGWVATGCSTHATAYPQPPPFATHVLEVRYSRREENARTYTPQGLPSAHERVKVSSWDVVGEVVVRHLRTGELAQRRPFRAKMGPPPKSFRHRLGGPAVDDPAWRVVDAPGAQGGSRWEVDGTVVSVMNVHPGAPHPNPCRSGCGLGRVLHALYWHCLLDKHVYQRFSKRWRSQIAVAFMATRKANRTMIAPEVFSTKARSGLSDHRKIWTGRAVAASVTPVGISTTKATIPIIRSGAVSPSARAIPMIGPVKIPGIASGST